MAPRYSAMSPTDGRLGGAGPVAGDPYAMSEARRLGFVFGQTLAPAMTSDSRPASVQAPDLSNSDSFDGHFGPTSSRQY
jgi:hypothetical protein